MENTNSVEAIEKQAQEILDKAGKKAAEILQKARKDARKIASPDLSLDDAQAEAAQIIQKARKDAEEKKSTARNDSATLNSNAEAKVGRLVERVFNIVTGSDN